MQFPIEILFKLMGWRARILMTDGQGHVIGYAPFSRRPKGRLPIYADESMSRVIYAIRWEHALTHWFEDGQGRRLGEYGVVPTAEGKFVTIGGRQRFRFVDETPWQEFLDHCIPQIPVVNAMTGAFLSPTKRAVRIQGGPDALRIVKKRLALDVRYTVHCLSEIDDRDQECLILSSMLVCVLDHYFSFR